MPTGYNKWHAWTETLEFFNWITSLNISRFYFRHKANLLYLFQALQYKQSFSLRRLLKSLRSLKTNICRLVLIRLYSMLHLSIEHKLKWSHIQGGSLSIIYFFLFLSFPNPKISEISKSQAIIVVIKYRLRIRIKQKLKEPHALYLLKERNGEIKLKEEFGHS